MQGVHLDQHQAKFSLQTVKTIKEMSDLWQES